MSIKKTIYLYLCHNFIGSLQKLSRNTLFNPEKLHNFDH